MLLPVGKALKVNTSRRRLQLCNNPLLKHVYPASLCREPPGFPPLATPENWFQQRTAEKGLVTLTKFCRLRLGAALRELRAFWADGPRPAAGGWLGPPRTKHSSPSSRRTSSSSSPSSGWRPPSSRGCPPQARTPGTKNQRPKPRKGSKGGGEAVSRLEVWYQDGLFPRNQPIKAWAFLERAMSRNSGPS